MHFISPLYPTLLLAIFVSSLQKIENYEFLIFKVALGVSPQFFSI